MVILFFVGLYSNKINMGYIAIDYNEGKARSYKKMGYKGVEISFGGTEKIFFTGNFERDWFEMGKFIITEPHQEAFWSMSSSINHFIMDNAPFISAYLHPIPNTDNEKWELIYWDETKHNYLNDSYIFDKGIEFFVKKGTQPTWEELKEKYGKDKMKKVIKHKQ